MRVRLKTQGGNLGAYKAPCWPDFRPKFDTTIKPGTEGEYAGHWPSAFEADEGEWHRVIVVRDGVEYEVPCGDHNFEPI